MKSSSRRSAPTTALAIIAILLIAVVGACSSSDPEDTATPQPATPSNTATVEPTARPTVTPVPPTATISPTSTPAPTVVPTIIPTATATPEPPGSYVLEMGRLFTELGIEFSTLYVASVGAGTWDNASLGCPQSGTYYDTADAPYSGFTYVISNGSKEWEYHVNQDDTVVIRCSELEPVDGPTVNITTASKLTSASKLTLMRRDFDSEDFLVRREMTPEDMARLIEIFDTDTDLAPATDCGTVFRLDFVTQNGIQEVEFICSENYQAFDIVWKGMQGTAPIIGKIIGPYLTGDPIPTLPTATP